MPNLIERRKMKRRLMTVAQPPVYNIYYTESVPIQQIPHHIQNLAQSFPQLSQPGYSSLIPWTTNNQTIQNSSEHFIPDEDQRRYTSMRYSNQALRPIGTMVDRQQSLPQNFCNYIVPDRQTNPSGISSSRQSCDRPNPPNQHITLPAQPVGCNQGYSMKIEVLAKPLKSSNIAKVAPLENELITEHDPGPNYLKIKDSMGSRNRHLIAEPLDSPSLQSNGEKKRVSLLEKIKRRMNRRRSGSMGYETEDGSVMNSAQEILSPRQLEDSSTNICSSIASPETPALSLYEPADRSKVVANSFQEALKSLEDSLKINPMQKDSCFPVDVVPSSSAGKSDSKIEPSSESFLCRSCKLKSDSDLEDHSRQSHGRDFTAMTSGSRAHPRSSCELWKTLYPRESFKDSSNETSYNSARRRDRLNDHSPPERDKPTRPLGRGTNSHGGIDRHGAQTGSDHPPGGNLACCGLVMYGQNEPIVKYDCADPLSPVRDECCARTIPVCGTVSRGLSPRYERNFLPPPYYEREACRSHEAMYRRSRYGRRDYSERFSIDEPRRRDRRGYERRYREDDSEFVAPPVLKSLVKAANMVFTSIFGKPTSRIQSRADEQRRQRVNQDRVSHNSTLRGRS